MDILYIDHYAGSDSMGMEFRPFYLAKEWQKSGLRTILLAADFSHLRKHNPTVRTDLEEQTIDGADFLFLKTRHYRGNGKDRILSMGQFVLKGLRSADELSRRFDPDVVICSSTYPMDTYIGQKIKQRTGAMLIHEIHDLWPLSPQFLGGYSSRHPFIRAMQAAEDSAYRHSDLIVSVLPNVTPHVRARGADTPVVYIPNGLPPSAFDEERPCSEKTAARIRQLKESGTFVVGYAGGISVSNAMEDLVRAMAILKDDPGIAAVIIGDGILKEALIRTKQSQGLDRVYFEDPIPKQEVIGTLEMCDALYIGSQPSPLYEYGVSANKIFDYLLAGRPIINAWDTSHSPMDYLGNTLKARAGDSKSIAEQIRAARALTKVQRDEIQLQSREFVRANHHYARLAEDFRRLFRERKR